MCISNVIYLDVETDWSRNLTIVGFRSVNTGLVQLIGNEITRTRLLRELPKGGRLFTFNGNCFDLPCIRQQLAVDLRERYDCLDLRWICHRHGIIGGQKRIERRVGVHRILKGLNGHDAMHLWTRYLRGDEEALRILLRYNAEDVAGLIAIRRHLSHLGILSTFYASALA